MPAWPGGPCPDCGDEMPANLVTCQSCRALLNSDLQMNFVDIPEFIPLQELDADEIENSSSSIVDSPANQGQILLVPAKGIYMNCLSCNEQLKIPMQFVNSKVSCNHCDAPFQCEVAPDFSNVLGAYVDCPHCQKRIRAGAELLNANVQCNHCSGPLHIEVKI